MHKTFEQVWKTEDNDAGSLLLASLDVMTKQTNEPHAKKQPVLAREMVQ